MTYAIGVNDQKGLQTIYWGQRLEGPSTLVSAKAYPEAASFDPSVSATPLEYAGWGGGLPTQPALKISFPDGNRSLLLDYLDSKQTDGPNGDQLEITLRDRLAEVYVHLFYKVYATGILARWSQIENRTKGVITVEQAASATLNLPPSTSYELSSLTGRWGAEWQLHTVPLVPGHSVLESRRGSTSHQSNPWLAIGRTGETTETSGPVWFGELGWSGSWQIDVEQTYSHRVKITGGYNTFDFSYPLAPGQLLKTPIFYVGYTNKGHGEASRILHRFQQKQILPGAPTPKPRPIIYNSWEATEFNVNEAGQLALAEKAASLGVERMVIDDGWFGQRVTDHAGLGDWYVNQTKFPHGLKPVIDRVHQLGMDFGIWVEPEMINPDSDLYRKHPEWAMSFPGRPRTEARNQLVLNLARDDVKQYLLTFLDKLVSENDIAFLKWDYNRNWSEPGWDAVPLPEQKEIYVRYINNLYEVLAELRKRHPKLEIESCSGGGGRVDLGILRYTDEVWPSDNTDALDRLSIQDGFSQAYTPGVMVAWVTDVPNFLDRRNIPLEFRFTVAMTGALGIGSDVTKWTPDESALATRLVAFYKTVRSTVQQGALYRLIAPEASEQSAVEYVAEDRHQAVLFGFLHSQHYGEPFQTIRLQGLEPAALYRVKPLDPSKAPGLPQQITGSELMGPGISLHLIGDYDSTAIVFEKVDHK
ncbi:alpha-galactosidase [Granulicella sp. S190]|uniref:alpha-galactosidase n=1 Tax=Granulicella sp. S190 TaxID=1747226 RepID=UPI0020B12609|nr:alpha-galactosidase [Granulicella sp. S190]